MLDEEQSEISYYINLLGVHPNFTKLEETIEDAENFCRNPIQSDYLAAPICFHGLNFEEVGFCASIPQCTG